MPAKSTGNALSGTRTVTHRIEKLSCIKCSVTHYQVYACLGASLKMMNWIGVDDTRSTRYLTTGVTKPIYENRHLLLTLFQNTPIQTIYQKKNRIYSLFVRLHSCSSCAFQNSNPSKYRRRTKKKLRTNAHRRNRRWERRQKNNKKNEENLLWISSCMCGNAENEMLTRADLWMGRERERAKRNKILTW